METASKMKISNEIPLLVVVIVFSILAELSFVSFDVPAANEFDMTTASIGSFCTEFRFDCCCLFDASAFEISVVICLLFAIKRNCVVFLTIIEGVVTK